ncbi:MAG: hypothetical protein ACK5OB_18860 [Pirellula sp.]
MPPELARSTRKSPRGLWLMDVAFVLMSTLVMFLVMRTMRFDDPRILHNAWTYFIGVPSLLIALSMLTRVLVSEHLERSIQVGFLGSVTFHLLFTLAATQLVIFRGIWEDGYEQVEFVAKAQSRATQFIDPEISMGTERPDYLKPVETLWTTPTEVEVPPTPPKDASIEPSKPEEREPLSSIERPLQRAQAATAASQPSLSAASKTLDRPNLSSIPDAPRRVIELPELDARPVPGVAMLPDRSVDAARQDQRDANDQDAMRFESLAPRFLESTLRAAPSTAQRATADDPNASLERAMQDATASNPVPTAAISKTSPQSPKIESAPVPIPETRPVESTNTESLTTAMNALADKGSQSTREWRQDAQADVAIPLSSADFPQIRDASNGVAQRAAPSAPAAAKSTAANSRDALNAALERAMQSDAKGPPNASSRSTSRDDTSRRAGTTQTVPVPALSSSERTAATGAAGSAESSFDGPAVVDRTGQVGRERSKSNASGGSQSEAVAALQALSNVPAPISPSPITSPFAGNPRMGLAPAPRDVGVPELRPPEVQLDRFRRNDLGGAMRRSAAVPIPAPAFKQRQRRNEENANDELRSLGTLGPQTEEAIERGLEFLARYQREDGSWRLSDFDKRTRMQSDTAATALALLAFQGAGYSHEQFKYQSTCRRAVDWLRANQRKNGDLYAKMDEASDLNAWLYSHAIATLAMCEAFGMTQDESIRESAQRAVDFLVTSQDPSGGGWRYTPQIGSDTSVTGWGMMALKSAELSGLRVPQEAYAGITKWLDSSEASTRERYLYRYNWKANTPQTQHGRIPTPVMTSVGLLMRLYLGWRRTHPDMARGSDWLLERPPALGTIEAPLRDTYYWYYATQVLFHMGGERWRDWYTRLYPILIASQQFDGPYAGSWDPAGEIPDAWGEYGGRLYVTTMNLLSLEVTYRHLPIYDATAK